MIYLFDKNLQLLDVLSLPLTATVNRRLVGVDRILVEDFADKIPIIDESSFAGAFLDDHFYIFKIIQKGLNNEKSYFEGVNYAYDELANLTIIEDKRPQDVTASTAILSAIEGTPWTLGTIESTSLQSTNFYFLTPLQAIQKVIEVWQIEPDFYFEFDGKKITGRKIDVYQQRGRLTGERYSYGSNGSNILEIVHEEDQSDVISALYGRGRGVEIFDEEGNPTGGYGRRIDFADLVWSKANGDPVDKPAGQAYVEIPEVTNQYGYPVSGSGLEPRYGVYINDQISDPVELLKETFDVLVQRSRPKVTFSSTVALAGPYELGDTNYIIREDLGIYYEARIFEDEVDLVNPDSTTFKFGDYIPSAQAERVRELQARFDGLTDKIQQVDSSVKNQIIKVSKDWYDALMESKEEIFFSGSSYNYSLEAGNEFGLPAGFYSFDAPIDGDPGPTNFLTIFAGKLGRGTILPGGAWDFDLIGDASGLTADAITVGTIKAQFIEIGPSSTFLEGYDPSTKANAGDVYTKTEMETRFTIRDGEISSKIVTEVMEQIETAPIYTWIKYADDAQGNGITDDPTDKPYMGVASGQTTATESNDPTAYIWSKIEGPPGVQGLPGLQGPEGDQGIQGPKGADGVSSYTHIAYANSANGVVDFSTSDSSRDYIGMYVDTLPADSTDPADYNWTLIKGAQGDQGIQGPTGPNGQTSYLHIAYATNSTGTLGFSTTVSDGKTYIGQYTDFISADSTDPAKYSWTLIKGEQGPQGIPGPTGPDGATLYTWIKYADTPTTGMSDTPTGKKYMGIAYNKTTATESSTYADYSWSLIEGPQGDQGIPGPTGPDGATLYTWIKYADTSTGTGMSDSPTGKKYMGIAYNKTTATESTTASLYSWSLIEGPQGPTGATGPQGIQGPKGADGTTYYTWIKYADTPTSGMSNYPDGKTYMGIAYNKITATESSTYADYTWSLIKGAQGDQGIQGPTGPQGNPTYTWVKYADTDTGSGMSDSPTGKRFLGLAHNKTTATESTNAADYQWSPLYDNVQVGGRNLLKQTNQSGKIPRVNSTVSDRVSVQSDENGVLTFTLLALNDPYYRPIYSLTPNDDIKTGEKYTISGKIYVPTGSNNTVSIRVLQYVDSWIGAKNHSNALISPDKKDEWVDFYSVFEWDNELANRLLLSIDTNGDTIGHSHKMKDLKIEKGNVATDWTPAPEDIQAEMDALAGEIGDVSQALTSLDGYVKNAFHDGIIDEAEAKAIEKYLNIVNTEKADVDAKYTKLYSNALLAGTAKTDLLAKKNLYNTAHTNLISAINTAISDGKTSPTEKANVDSKFTAYKTALTNLSTAFETASAYLVNAVNGKIEGEGGILTRLITVEDKVTDNAIISTVEERVSVDGSLVLATKSDITQTKDEWKATFSQVGGVNLIEIVKSTNGYYLSATGSAAVNASWAYTDYIEVVPGDKYFVSGFTNLGTSPSTCFYSSTKAFISGVAGSARETVLAPANAKYMRFSFLIADKPNLMLEKEGGTRTSSTAINDEGVTVEDSIAPNKTTIFPSGMMVRNKETLKQLLTVEPDLTYIPELSADNIYSDSISRAVGNYSFQEINYYVAPTATGDGTGRDESNKADNIQTALRNATNDGLILKNVNIIINVAPGKYNGLIRIMGYSGNGEIAILFGAGVYINGNIDIIDCSCRVRLNSGATGNFVLTKGTYLNPVTIINCSHVMLERPVIIHPLSTGYPIYIESSRVVVSSYDIAGSGGVSPARAVYADYNSQVYMMFGKGNTQNGPFNASRGSIITAYYGIPNPALSSAADCDTTTGTYFGKSTTRTNSTATPPTITWQTVTKTFQGRLYRVNNATGYKTDGSFIQGTSPNTGESYKGYVSWGKEIYDYLQDNGGYQSLTSIKLITERGGYGYGNVSLKVASPAARTGTSQARYSTAETELVGYTLGTSVSTSQNLILSTTTTATADYANFTKVLLKITVQKKV